MATDKLNEKRIKQRFSVNLKSTGNLEGQEQQFLISNLSATGARLHFETKATVKIGMSIALSITIPNTVLRVQTEANVMWVTRQGNAISLGIKFKEPLSDTMVQQLIKKD